VASFLPDTDWIGGWVGPRTGLNVVVKRKLLLVKPAIVLLLNYAED
jgi:hypothetical protein